MGVTIHSKNRSIDMGYGGFFRLRQTVARLANPELGKCYEQLMTISDEEINKCIDKNRISTDICSFLFQPDCEGKLKVTECQRIFELIKDYNDNFVYGYAGLPDAASFADFKAAVKDGIDSHSGIRWL